MSKYTDYIDAQIEALEHKIEQAQRDLYGLRYAREVIEKVDADNAKSAVKEIVEIMHGNPDSVRHNSRAKRFDNAGLTRKIVDTIDKHGPIHSRDIRETLRLDSKAGQRVYSILHTLRIGNKIARDDDYRYYIDRHDVDHVS